ncbi:oxidoreductase [Gordonia phage CaiB]|nr:oxidoreductase [Gordonia phage CaiB]
MTIHIEGMGWLGAVTALCLERQGIEFTWHDIDAPHVAWKASTGLVYPAGDERSTRDMKLWGSWYRSGVFPSGTVEKVAYVYGHKAPPHEGRYDTSRLSPHLTLAHAPCYAVNAPEIVRFARRRFAAVQAPDPGTGTLIRAHAGRRLDVQMWGWNVPVRLKLPTPLADADIRPAIYGRRVRRIAYAYPIPGTDQWWGGSTLIRQSKPRELDVMKHVQRWLTDFTALFPEVGVEIAAEPMQGWRPRPAENDTSNMPRWARGDRPTIEYPPLWHSGIRWSPAVLQWTLAQLRR